MTNWYLSKALNYALKDVVLDAEEEVTKAWHNLVRLDQTARETRCRPGCNLKDCRSKVLRRFGARSHMVSASRRTSGRPDARSPASRERCNAAFGEHGGCHKPIK